MRAGARLRPPVVLAYHGVGEPGSSDPERLVLPVGRFDSQLRWLRRVGYRFLTMADLVDAGGRPPPRTAVLTFDDGWADATTTLLPKLNRLGIRATFYVCPGWLGGQHPLVAGAAGRLMAARDIESLAQSGMDIGSHTMVHRDLRGLSDEELHDDLRQSKEAVETITEQACRTLAYPYGLFDARVEAATAGAGYDLSLAWLPGEWRPTAVPRIPAPPRNGGARLLLKLLGVRRSGR